MNRGHPVLLEDAVVTLAVADGEAQVDPQLRAAGAAHLEEVLARRPASFNGVVLVLDRVEDGVMHVVRGRYFDMIATCDALAHEPGLRERAGWLADGNALRSGHGRAAAVGVTAIVPRGGVFTLGRRSPDVALDPGRWHVVPSGTIDERGLDGTLRDELATEHGITEPVEARTIAFGWDLTRLRPELTLMTADLGDIGSPPASAEFTEFRDVALDLDAIDATWDLDLTPAAALALAALERELQS